MIARTSVRKASAMLTSRESSATKTTWVPSVDQENDEAPPRKSLGGPVVVMLFPPKYLVVRASWILGSVVSRRGEGDIAAVRRPYRLARLLDVPDPRSRRSMIACLRVPSRGQEVEAPTAAVHIGPADDEPFAIGGPRRFVHVDRPLAGEARSGQLRHPGAIGLHPIDLLLPAGIQGRERHLRPVR